MGTVAVDVVGVNAAAKPRLLIVDDEPANIQVLAAGLKDDFQVYFATSGEQALAMARDKGIDLVLLDVVMPGIDGFEVLRRLKDNPRTQGIPVIFVTAMSEVDDETRGLDLGAVDYVSKPFRLPVVRARIRTHLELRRQRELLARHAFIDALTGIGNRRRFDESWGTAWNAALRAQQPLALVLLDVDHFKAYNDHYGHAVGDDALRQVAAALDHSFARAEDVVARYGGEEFAVILRPAEHEAFAAQLQRMVDAVWRLAISHAASSVAQRVSISAGAIRWVPSETEDPEQRLQAVDGLLYAAKSGGRNQCRFHDEVSDESGVIRPAETKAATA